MSLSILPFSLQPPSGYSLPPGSSGAQTADSASASAQSAGPVDVIAIRNDAVSGGNFTAVAGDTYRMSDLFKAAAPNGQKMAGFRVALGDGDGLLQLEGVDVSARTTFTADEFAHLTYTAGAGPNQSLLVVGQTGTRVGNGPLTREVDSPAVQITASVTGSRSINAMNALLTQPTGADANIAALVKQAGVFTGVGGAARPTLQTMLPLAPTITLSALEEAVGTYRQTGVNLSSAEIDLSSFNPDAIGSSVSPGTFASPGGKLAAALLLLDGAAVGAFRIADNLSTQTQAIKAYNTTKGL